MEEKAFKLYNNVTIPCIGFGTWQISPKDAYTSTLCALKCGYRHIDTAYAYGNEKEIGMAIKDSLIPREEIFVVTKLPAEIKTYEGAKEYFYSSLKNLGLEYVDLYLIHAPWPWDEIGRDCSKENIEVWKAFIELYNAKLIRSIGVSNFNKSDIENLITATKVKPMVNQICYFISHRQEDVVSYCQSNDILIEAYSPLGTGKILNKEVLIELAHKYNKSVANICIKYCLQNECLPLPKSIHESRIKENLDLDFVISDEDMKYLDSLNNID